MADIEAVDSSPESVWDFFQESLVTLTFNRRPDPIPGDLRTSWRLASLVLILDKARGGSASLAQVQVLSWAIRSGESQEVLSRWFAGEKRPDEILVRFDPAVSVTVDLAVGFGLAELDSAGNVKISGEGRDLARRIWESKDVLTSQKEFLQRLPKIITKKSIQEMLDWR